MTDLSAAERNCRILAAVRAIPAGQVAGYGEVARRAGFPRGARLAAKALAGSDADGVPWHRVVRSDGRIAFPANSPQWHEQVSRLRGEGVVVDRGRVRLPAGDFDLDAAIWG